ncbi:MAG: S9 family peptidase [Chloroflexota bacterium]|nr:S9 family peptidase [Chloroflexota bacterium]
MDNNLLIDKQYSITRYLNTRNAYFPGISHDGERIAFITDITGVPQVWQTRATAEPLWPEQLTFASDRVSGVWLSPAPGDGRLIYAHDVGGNENAQLFLLSADGAVDVPLTAGFEDAMHIFGEWSVTGSQITYAANRRDPGLFDLYLQSLDGEARLVWQNEVQGFLYNPSFSPDGKRIIVTLMKSSFSHDLIEIDLVSGADRLITLTDEDVRFNSVFYSSDNRSLIVNTDIGSDFLYIGRIGLQDLTLDSLVSLEWDVDMMALSPDGTNIAFQVNKDGASKLKLLDLTTGSVRQAPEFHTAPGVISWMDQHMEFSAASDRLVFSFTGADAASDIYVWDIPSDHIQAVTSSSHGGIPPGSFITPVLIHYPTFDHDQADDPRMIPAWYYEPAKIDGGSAPAIVVVHGGPESQYRPYFNFLVQYFLNCGYAVLAPNVRGSTGYGKTYSHLDDVEGRMDSVADLAYAAYWLQAQPDINADQLVVYGGSYGGFMVLSALTTYPDLWAAGVNIVGISSFVTFLENTSEYRRTHREAEYGSLEGDREFLESISPINHVDRITAPLIVIHGANDPRVPLGEAEQLVEALDTRGVPVEFLVFDDEGHGLAKMKNKGVAYPAIVAFLEKQLSLTDAVESE